MSKGKNTKTEAPVKKTPPETVSVPAAETIAAEQTELPAGDVTDHKEKTETQDAVPSVKTSIQPGEAAKRKEQPEFIAPYVKAYPKEKVFHVTSDRQVFFEKDRSLAVMHQNSLGGEEKVQTVAVK